MSKESSQKLIDTWYYQYVGVAINEDSVAEPHTGQEADESINESLNTQAGQIKVAVKLYLHKKFGDSNKPPLATKEVWFSVECESPTFSVAGPNIECLRVAMWEKLDAHFAIKWESYFKVQISPGYVGYGLNFEYTSVEKGTAWDGTLLLRESNYRMGRVIRPWPGDFRDGQGQVLACIPATQESERALREFGARIHELRRKLADFLRPDSIMATLANLGAISLLPSPRTDDMEDL